MIAPTAIIRGIGQSVGLTVLDVPMTTGYYDSNLNNKAIACANALQHSNYSFAFIHVKAVDDAGHDKDTSRKI